jgi:hypothetical protein
MYRVWIQRKASESKFKGKRLMGQPRIRKFCQVLEDIKKKGKCWQRTEKERL